MPFDNVPVEDAERLGHLLRSDALRPRKRNPLTALAASQAPALGKHSSNNTNGRENANEEEAEEQEQRRRATSTEPMYFNQMAYVDRVVAAMDALQYHYALRQEDGAGRGGNIASRAEEGDDSTHRSEDTEDEKDPVERPLPFPCLFLHSPADFVRRSWATAQPPAKRRAAAAGLSSALRPPPPASLLSTSTQLPHSSSSERGSSGTDQKPSTPASPPNHMYTLDFAKDAQAARRVVTVLQGEIGLAISTDYSAAVDAHETDKKDEADADKKEIFLMSPDATSCVLLACRVSLHPQWQARARQVTAAADTAADAAAPSEAGPNAKGSTSEEGCSAPGEGKHRFLRLVGSTHTATMAHLDRTEDLVTVMDAMVWEAAVPAWLHAVGQHYSAATDGGHSSGIDGGGERTANAVPENADAAVRELQLLLDSESQQSVAAPLVEVEWYMVGGMREKTHTAPVLTALFQSFFPPTTTTCCNEGSGRETGQRAVGAARELLSTALPLSSLLVTPEGGSTASASSTAAMADDGVVVTIGHRLREDAFCLWSFNTCLQNWHMDRNPNNHYAFPVCYGLLVNVSTGDAWPCQMQPGRRAYALANVRPLFATEYHFTFPLEHECAPAGKGKSNTEAGEAVSVGSVPVYQQLLAYGEVLSKFWASGQEAPKSSAALREVSVHSLTLSLFVAQCLGVLRRQQQQQQPSTEHEERGRPHPSGRTFPYLLRTRMRDLWSRVTGNGPNGVPFTELPEHFFLQCSTTPHCEPPDFGAMVKRNFISMTTAGPEDMFAAFLGGGGGGGGGSGSGEAPDMSLVAGILFV